LKNVPLPLSYYASVRNIKRLFLGPGTVQSTAVEIEVLCPEEQGEFSPSIYLNGQLDKITGAARGTDIAAQIYAITKRDVIHAATIAYHIRNAVLLDGTLYSGKWKLPLREQSLDSERSATEYLERAALASTMFGTQYFGHWLKDDCLQYLLAEMHGPLCVRPQYIPYQQSQYESYLLQDWTPTGRARIDHLIVYQDFGQNSYKRRRHEILTDRIRSRITPKSNDLVYLKRGQTGIARPIENEDEIIQMLVKTGFVVVDVAADSLEHVIASLLDAKIVVSVEGSHTCHCWFSPENRSGVITLQPPDRFTSINKGWIDGISARFGFVVGDKAEGGNRFSLSDIAKTVDLMMTNLARSAKS
jgi:hypothetical protein